MERCDFASIMGILRSYIREDQEQNQTDLMYLLFDSFVSDKENLDFDFDNGLVCRWLSGQARVSPRVSGYYFEQKHRRRLAYDLYGHIVPLLSDPGMAAEKVYSLLLCDPSISESKKQELTRGYPCPGEEEVAEFLAEVLSFGMGREFVKRDPKRKALTADSSLSPLVQDLIYGAEVPRPCQHFCGREKELQELHALLEENRHVFLRGMAGIGKSELAKAYAKQYKKDYTNILYIPCTGDLKQDILDLDFADDLPASSQEERFRKHNRFLRALKEDSLLILDNFHATDQEDLLSVLLGYRCRILFTTRNLREGAAEFVLGEIGDMEALLTLFGAFYDGTETHRETVSEIIETVHRHTLAVELAARLLDCGLLRPKALLKKLRAEKVKLDASDHIRITKDGKAAKETYKDASIPADPSSTALTTKAKVILRASGTADGKEVAVLTNKNTKCTLQGKTNKADGYVWYKVKADGKTGWVRGDLLHILSKAEAKTYSDSKSSKGSLYTPELVEWSSIKSIFYKGCVAKVTDVQTGISFKVKRWSGGLHADVEPYTAADTKAMCKIYGVSTAQQISDYNLYQRRSILVTIGSHSYAASMYGVPHNYPEGDTIDDNNYKGQFCIHFVNSKVHASKKVDSAHQNAIKYAFNYGESVLKKKGYSFK